MIGKSLHAATENRASDRVAFESRKNVAHLAGASCDRINRRLKELDQEMDVDRAFQLQASLGLAASLSLGWASDRRWLCLGAAITGFLVQHSLQRSCLPVTLLRQMGFRTAQEITEERYALKALRGDFNEVEGPCEGEADIQALERFEGEGGPALDEPPDARRHKVDVLLEAVSAY